MTPLEYAREIFDKATNNWELIFPGNPNLKSFIVQTANNEIGELSLRRAEFFKPDEPEYQEDYWQSVKTHIQSL